MKDLHEDLAAARMDRLRHGSPAFDLRFRIDSRRADVTLGHRRDVRRFGDDESGGSTLAVIPGGVGRLNSFVVVGAATRHRRHDDAVVDFHVSETKRVEQCRHKFLSLSLFGSLIYYLTDLFARE